MSSKPLRDHRVVRAAILVDLDRVVDERVDVEGCAGVDIAGLLARNGLDVHREVVEQAGHDKRQASTRADQSSWLPEVRNVALVEQ
eukprot:3228609-Heterocapsa_arctica.AAC.1